MYRLSKAVWLTTALLAISGTTTTPAASHQATNTASSDVAVVTTTQYFEPPPDPLTPSYPAIDPASSYTPAVIEYHKTASHSANATTSSSSAFFTKHSKNPTTPATSSHSPKPANTTTSLPAIIKYHETATHQPTASPTVVIAYVAASGPPAAFPRAYRPLDEISPHRTTCQVTRKIAHRSYDITGWAWSPNKTKDEQEHWNWSPIKAQELYDEFRRDDFKFRFHLFPVDEGGYQKFTIQMNMFLDAKYRTVDHQLNTMLGLKTVENHSDRSIWCTKKPRTRHEPKLSKTPLDAKWDWEIEGDEKGEKGHESGRVVAFEA